MPKDWANLKLRRQYPHLLPPTQLELECSTTLQDSRIRRFVMRNTRKKVFYQDCLFFWHCFNVAASVVSVVAFQSFTLFMLSIVLLFLA